MVKIAAGFALMVIAASAMAQAPVPPAAVPAPAASTGNAWQRSADAKVERVKRENAQALEAMTMPAGTDASAHANLTEIGEHAVSILQNQAEIVGADWQADANRKREAATQTFANDLNAISSQAQDRMRASLDAAAAALGMESPTGRMLATAQADAKRDLKLRYRLFVSQSMGMDALLDAMRTARGHHDMALVFRGMKPDQTATELSQLLAKLASEKGKLGMDMPTVLIDPVHFQSANVTVAPVLVKYDDDDKPIARVQGIANPGWLDEQLESGRKGDLGTMGPIKPLAEQDMMLVMQERAKGLDLAKMKQRALDGYWKKVEFLQLPAAREQRVFKVDPTVVVTADITTPDGKVIARKGDRYNPLHSIGFHQKMLIFDATDPLQLDYARAFLAANKTNRVVLITTAVDRDAGWNGYTGMEAGLKHAVFVLNQSVLETWKLAAVPSVVTAEDSLFVVSEVPVHQGGSNVADYPPQR